MHWEGELSTPSTCNKDHILNELALWNDTGTKKQQFLINGRKIDVSTKMNKQRVINEQANCVTNYRRNE